MSNFYKENEKQILFALRCAKTEYNSNLLTNGSIKFNTPQKWVNDGKEKGDGRGDVEEGMFAKCHESDKVTLQILNNKFKIPCDEIIVETINHIVYFRRKETMNLPAYCLYYGDLDLFNIKKTGWQIAKGNITERYFKDFSDNEEQHTNYLPDDEKSSFVLITDFPKFKERLVKKLLEMGILENELIVEPIYYYNFKINHYLRWFEIDSQAPRELLYKDKKFRHQNEIRFIVNSKNENAMNILRNEVINIGSIADIAQFHQGDFKKGVEVNLKINIGIKEENK